MYDQDFAVPRTDCFVTMQRRSTDGFISATGMFKTAFPWAKHAEAAAEHEYLKSLKTTGQDEVAGNVWIPAAFGTITDQRPFRDTKTY